MGLAKNRENVEYLVKISPTGQIPLSDFFTKLRAGRMSGSVGPTLTLNFTVLTLKIWAYSRKNRRNL